MQKLNYDLVHKLDIHTTNKLLDFINNDANAEDILKKIEVDFPFSLDDGNKLRLTSWISLDYIDEDGKTFIDKFLESDYVTSLERDILLNKNKSFISIFEILTISDEYMLVLDLLQNKEFTVWEKALNGFFDEGEILFSRIGKIFDEYTFMGDVSFLPKSVKDIFMEQYIIDLNEKRKDDPSLVVEDYLKKHSIEILIIYNNCILSVIDTDDDLDSSFYEDLDEFEGYLSTKIDIFKVKGHLANLIEFFDYYLAKDDLTLYNFKDVDLNDFFDMAIKDNIINSKESLNSYIDTFKKYLFFLSKNNKEFIESYNNIINISRNRFTLMSDLDNSDSLLSIDRNLEKEIENSLNEVSVTLILNFDKFLLYLIDGKIEVTPKRKSIKKKFLRKISYLLNDKDQNEDFEPSRSELFMIDVFYNISLQLNLVSLLEENIIKLNKAGIAFLNSKDGEKFSLILSTVWKYLDSIDYSDHILKFAMDLESHVSYDVKELISKYGGISKEVIDSHEYFKILGLTESNYCPSYTWEITSLGKIVFDYYYDLKFTSKNDKIIDLNSYKQLMEEEGKYGES